MDNQNLYIESMVLIYNNSKIIGWMATDKEADAYCKINHDTSWDYYSNYLNNLNNMNNMNNIIHIKKIPFMTKYD